MIWLNSVVFIGLSVLSFYFSLSAGSLFSARIDEFSNEFSILASSSNCIFIDLIISSFYDESDSTEANLLAIIAEAVSSVSSLNARSCIILSLVSI